MKLNPDCVRDILLTVEDITDLNNWLDYPKEKEQCPLLSKYEESEVKYHMNQCYMQHLIICDPPDLSYSFIIKDLSPMGHSFIGDIRSDTVWKKVKQTGKDLGVYSLDALVTIASGVVTNLISGCFKGI